MKICPQCNTEYAPDQRFCPLDGATLRSREGGTGDLVGAVIADRYHVLRKLGEGGMGQVYLAEHVRMGRKSALKVMHPRMVQDADAISRFNREAANASRINHPHVAAVYDFGETGDGLIYLAMEYVDGEPLTALVSRGGSLPAPRAATIIRQAAEALSVAHDMGIVHRDLKPDNIMLTKHRDGSDCVKVVDFGIAKANDASQKVTRTGLVIGTPEYMSPEQLAGDTLDGRSDTYSLAIVAFTLLTGKLPFPSESAQESMIMRLTDRPRRLDEMRPEVAWPAALQRVMDRALERDAEQRYASAAEFGREFASAIDAMPASAAMEAGTMILDSTATGAVHPEATRVGATEVLVPGTRVAGSVPTASVAAPSVAAASVPAARGPRPRTAILAAAAVLVLGGGTAAALKLAGTGAPTDAPASASTAPGPAGREPAAIVQGEADGGAPAPTAQRTAERSGPAPSGPGRVVTPAGGAESPERVDVDGELAAILETLEDATSATRAVARIDRLAESGALPRGSEAHTWAQYARAQAYLYLDRHADGCAILAGLRGKSARPVRNQAIDATYHAVSCQ